MGVSNISKLMLTIFLIMCAIDKSSAKCAININ